VCRSCADAEYAWEVHSTGIHERPDGCENLGRVSRLVSFSRSPEMGGIVHNSAAFLLLELAQ
jgi:hypothetical protein